MAMGTSPARVALIPKDAPVMVKYVSSAANVCGLGNSGTSMCFILITLSVWTGAQNKEGMQRARKWGQSDPVIFYFHRNETSRTIPAKLNASKLSSKSP